MTATAQRRPIAGHPAFVPLIALWLAAAAGLTIAVLPAAIIERAVASAGLSQMLPLSVSELAAVSAAAALLGAMAGIAVARPIARRAGGDPRPIYDDAESSYEDVLGERGARRPLHVREELAGGFGDESELVPGSPNEAEPPAAPPAFAGRSRPDGQDGFMILTPQPIHPPHPAPELEALLDQFDNAFVAFQADSNPLGEASRQSPDPVQAFVARQTGAPPPPARSPIGGLVPDHQAELRAALDKLARSQNKL